MKNNKKPNKNWNYVFDIIEFVILMRDEMCDFQIERCPKPLLKKSWEHNSSLEKIMESPLLDKKSFATGSSIEHLRFEVAAK